MSSRVLRGVRASALAFPALLLLPASPHADIAAKGISYSFTTTTQTTTPKGPGQTRTMSGKGQVACDNARIDFTDVTVPGGNAAESGASQPLKKESYFLFRKGGHTMTVVDTKERKYYEMDFDALMQGLGALGGVLKIEISDADVKSERVQPDTTVEGFRTQHYRLTQSYTMKMSVLGMKQSSKAEGTSEYYFAPEFKDVTNPFMNAGMGAVASMFNNSEYLQKLRAAMAQMYQGMPVLTVTRLTSTDGKGNKSTTLGTSKVTNVARVDIPASVFEIPSGYTKVEQQPAVAAGKGAPEANKANGGATSSVAGEVVDTAKQGVKQGVKEAVNEAAKEKAKKKIRGLFGKP